MSTEFSIFANGQSHPLEAEVVDELVRRLNLLGIDRRSSWTGEIIERMPSTATASRIKAALDAGETSFVPNDEDKNSLAWALREWVDRARGEEIPASALTLRDALAAESKLSD